MVQKDGEVTQSIGHTVQRDDMENVSVSLLEYLPGLAVV